MSITPLLQGNIRVFCRVRPLVGGGLSKHIQLPSSDDKTITLAKTEEVRDSSVLRGQFVFCLMKQKETVVLLVNPELNLSALCCSVSHR